MKKTLQYLICGALLAGTVAGAMVAAQSSQAVDTDAVVQTPVAMSAPVNVPAVVASPPSVAPAPVAVLDPDAQELDAVVKSLAKTARQLRLATHARKSNRAGGDLALTDRAN